MSVEDRDSTGCLCLILAGIIGGYIFSISTLAGLERQERQETARDLVTVADVNNDGIISAQEWAPVFGALGREYDFKTRDYRINPLEYLTTEDMQMYLDKVSD